MKWRAQDMENNSLSNKSKAIALFKWIIENIFQFP